MRTLLQFASLQGDGVFDIPRPDHEVVVEHNTMKEVHDFILRQRDPWGHSYQKSNPVNNNYDYISQCGAVRVKEYIQPTIINIVSEKCLQIH